MAIYLCDNCGEMKDDDYDPPENLRGMDLVCTSCITDLPADDDGDYKYDQWKDKQLEEADDGTPKET